MLSRYFIFGVIYSHMYGCQTHNGRTLLVNQNKEFVNYDNVVTQ